MSKIRKYGFSLIELSIVILIASVFASIMINILGKKTLVDKNAETQLKLARIGEALKIYWQTGSRHYFPCPASLTEPLDSNKLGDGQSSGAQDCPMRTGDDGSYINSGMVPFTELNLPPQYAFDSWGNRITYVVDKRLAGVWDATTISSIYMMDKDGNTLLTRTPQASEIGQSYTVCINGGTDTATDYSTRIAVCPAFLLISHGANGYLAFNAAGTQKSSSYGTTHNEKENTPASNGDAGVTFDNVFVSAPINQDTKSSDLNNSNYFDDIVYFKPMNYFTGTDYGTEAVAGYTYTLSNISLSFTVGEDVEDKNTSDLLGQVVSWNDPVLVLSGPVSSGVRLMGRSSGAQGDTP